MSVSLFGDDLVIEGVYDNFDFADEFLAGVVLAEGALHVLPHAVVVFGSDGHMLMGGVKIPALVVVGPSEDHREEICHQVVQYCDVAHVLQIEDVEGIVVEDGLVEVAHDLLDVAIAAQAFVDRRHPPNN